jgi:tetratricopeptide (TPR) repeat protein
MQVLSSLVPFIDKQCNTAVSSRIYLKFSQIMLSAGDFSSALEIFGKISQQPESNSQYTESLLCLIKEAVNKDNIALIRDIILQRLDRDIVQHAIYKTVIDICQEYSFEALIKHIHSFTDLTLFHNRSDQLFLDGIRLLVERGFLTSYDPSILIRLADTIKDSSIREQAISNIVTKIAQIGVRTKNRDYLQRAVGLTVEIDEQSTRSTTLSSIIDEASILAAQQADLDLLLRMKAWSASLLDTNLADYAMANIIQGIIKYAAVKISPEALEEAFIIAKEINDPSLRSQLIEHIAECFVKVGCINLRDNKSYITVSDFSSAFYPFERGLAIIKQNHKSPQISLKIAGIIDIIISQSRISDNPDFIIPLALYSNEIENPFERNAMMSRIISNIDDSVHHPDSTDPYEIMVYFLQRNKYAKSVPVVLNLIYSILQKISNPYVRLSGLGNLADSLIKIHDFRHANNIFDSIHKSIPNLPAEYQKVLMLCDLTMLYCRIDREKAKKCLNEALEKLDKVEPDNISIVHRQVVSSIVSIYAIDSDEQWINVALRIITRIVDPIEYIYSLIIVNSIIKEDPARFHDLLRHMIDAIENIHSPYEKAAVILDIIPLTLKHRDIHTSEVLLKKANALTKKINIQYIADSIRHDIGRIYFELYKKYGDKKNLTNALAVSQSIYSDDIRLELITEIGQEGTYEEPVYYSKIKTLSEKIITEGVSPTQVASLERLVRSIADRGKEALFFCDLALFYKRAGDEKLSRKMLQSAIKEASIIRPLSRRAYIICDIAMKTYAAGFESDSQGLFDHAIDAATNIRQSSIRDEVFEELGLAMKIMQEIKS